MNNDYKHSIFVKYRFVLLNQQHIVGFWLSEHDIELLRNIYRERGNSNKVFYNIPVKREPLFDARYMFRYVDDGYKTMQTYDFIDKNVPYMLSLLWFLNHHNISKEFTETFFDSLARLKRNNGLSQIAYCIDDMEQFYIIGKNHNDVNALFDTQKIVSTTQKLPLSNLSIESADDYAMDTYHLM